MPGLDGYQLAIKIKDLYPHIKIQLISGYSDGRHIDENNKLIDHNLHKNLLYKPYKIQDLLLQLRNLLDTMNSTNTNTSTSDMKTVKNSAPSVLWDDSLSVHIPAIDNDHKYLFQLFSYFEQAMIQNNTDEITDSFDKLIQYIEYHFQREEEIMEACKYPGLLKHHQVHEMFKKQIMDHFSDFKNNKLKSKELLIMYKNWLLDHVSGMDQSIGVFCEGKVDLINKIMEKSTIPPLNKDDLK
jgi:hemerythrin-like metal-binding protein